MSARTAQATKVKSRRPRAAGLGSRYPWVRGRGDVHSAAASRREIQAALVERYWRWFRSANTETQVSELGPGYEPAGSFIQKMLLRAALPLVARRPLDEVCPSKGEVKDASVIAEEALPFLRWAQQWTRVSNPLVLVEFATQMAYDHAFRGQVMLTLGDAPPSLWWWSGGRQHCWPNPDGYFPPVLGNEVKKLLDKTTAFEKRHIPRVSAVSPFVGLPLRALWSHDPVRPPVQALRRKRSGQPLCPARA